MQPWSRLEVEALVADHLEMLARELRGEPYSKADHRRGLGLRLGSRSEGAIERKHQNVSAILIELGIPYIDGYKPLGNYQGLLAEVVRERVASNGDLLNTIAAAVTRDAVPPGVEDPESCLVEAPRPGGAPGVAREGPLPPRLGVDYLALEAANRSLGTAGEQFVVRYERARLARLGHVELAEQVEHVAETRGDGLGYDVLSFDIDGAERFIEVKTTSYGPYTPFFVTRNELAFSREEQERYHLYRLFGFRRPAPRLFSKPGPLSDSFTLDPSQYEARIG